MSFNIIVRKKTIQKKDYINGGVQHPNLLPLLQEIRLSPRLSRHPHMLRQRLVIRIVQVRVILAVVVLEELVCWRAIVFTQLDSAVVSVCGCL